MKIKQAIQVGSNVTDIFNLPCVESIKKVRGGYYATLLINEFSKYKPQAFKGDWICQYDNGKWFAMSDKDFQSVRKLYGYEI